MNCVYLDLHVFFHFFLVGLEVFLIYLKNTESFKMAMEIACSLLFFAWIVFGTYQRYVISKTKHAPDH